MTDSNINGCLLPQTVSCANNTQNQASSSGAQGINCNAETILSAASAIGTETSYQSVSQSMAQWIQSAALFSQNTLVTTTATTAVFENKIADIVSTEEPTKAANDVAELTVAMSAFLQTVAEGTDRIAASIGRTANHILNGYPAQASNATADPATTPAATTPPESSAISPTPEPTSTDSPDSNSSAAAESSVSAQTTDSES